MRLSPLVLIGGAFLASARPAVAQLTVQQPVFQNFSAATTVSVPDRGSAFIGGVNRAASGRTTFGPLRSGSSLGLEREASGMSVGVYIHDFDEMDRQILGQAPLRDPAAGLSGNTAHAWRSLSGRDSHPLIVNSIEGPQPGSAPRPPASLPPSPDDRVAKFLALGEKAEARGAVNVARMHYRLAAKYGSDTAAARLASIDASPLATRD